MVDKFGGVGKFLTSIALDKEALSDPAKHLTERQRRMNSVRPAKKVTKEEDKDDKVITAGKVESRAGNLHFQDRKCWVDSRNSSLFK